MNIATHPAQLKAAATYNAAADHFDAAPLGFWERHGRRAVELAVLRRGQRVLDVGCGTGASALPAAKSVGPSGQVIGIDLAEKMLKRARIKAAARGLGNVEFRVADMAGSGLPDEGFDAIVSAFSLFFVVNMERQVGELWRMLRPGGRLVVAVWGPRPFLEPAASIFDEELRLLRPDTPRQTPPWELLARPEELSRMIVGGGAAEPALHFVPDVQPLSDPTDWWTIALGSGLRWAIEQLDRDEQRGLKARVLRRIEEKNVVAVEANAIHAVAQKPS